MQSLTPHLGSPSTGVVITGGASGIGLATARAVAAVGRPVAIWDISAQKAEAALEAVLAEHRVAAVACAVDVRSKAEIDAAAVRTRAALPSIGGLVHCAGIVDVGSLEGITEKTWEDGINIHLRPVYLLLQVFLEDLRRHPGSSMVALSSINATLGNAVNPIYSAGKGGVLSLVRSLADRLGRDGIRINSVSPGQILTPMLQPSVQALPQNFFEKRILLERLGAPEEIARVIRFLLSDEASYITAAELIVDGGNVSSQR